MKGEPPDGPIFVLFKAYPGTGSQIKTGEGCLQT